jgi:uncharacterized protein YcgL (UPF0745 family)
MKCIVYRCSKKQEMYLFVPCTDDTESHLQNLPETLLRITGNLTEVMQLELAPERKLARANVIDVINAIEQQGFYIQMPPNELLRKDDSMLNNPSDSF